MYQDFNIFQICFERIPPDMIERISRLSQAFVEDVPEAPGKVCDTVEHLVWYDFLTNTLGEDYGKRSASIGGSEAAHE